LRTFGKGKPVSLTLGGKRRSREGKISTRTEEASAAELLKLGSLLKKEGDGSILTWEKRVLTLQGRGGEGGRSVNSLYLKKKERCHGRRGFWGRKKGGKILPVIHEIGDIRSNRDSSRRKVIAPSRGSESPLHRRKEKSGEGSRPSLKGERGEKGGGKVSFSSEGGGGKRERTASMSKKLPRGGDAKEEGACIPVRRIEEEGKEEGGLFSRLCPWKKEDMERLFLEKRRKVVAHEEWLC